MIKRTKKEQEQREYMLHQLRTLEAEEWMQANGFESLRDAGFIGYGLRVRPVKPIIPSYKPEPLYDIYHPDGYIVLDIGHRDHVVVVAVEGRAIRSEFCDGDLRKRCRVVLDQLKVKGHFQ